MLLAGGLCAQSLSFEVASVKPAAPDAERSGLSTPNANDLNVESWPVRNLIKFAYSLQDYQLIGGPKWLDTDRYDITAKAPRDEPLLRLPADPKERTAEQLKTRGDRLRERVRWLLADRFGLVVHRETREHTVYVLEVAKNGPKMKLVTTPGEMQGLSEWRLGRIKGTAADMDILAHFLATAVGTNVSDNTGLKGMYDFTLDWTPDSDAPSPDGEPAPPPMGPTLFAALQDQLGLRLRPVKGSVEVMVIDQAKRPAAN
jgi:uncharacterized protein (TIGR03435 family)